MMSPTRSDDNNDEESPLLRVQSHDTPQKPTPLPIFQISILVLPWTCEAIAFCSIGPYINQVRRMFLRLRHIGSDQHLACWGPPDRWWRRAQGWVLHGNYSMSFFSYTFQEINSLYRVIRCPYTLLPAR